jgi:thymidylate synthase (FAD)
MTTTDHTPVLDKGFVRLVEFMGGDGGVVDAARVSYGGKSKGAEADRKLIGYLLQHSHMTPFEHALFKFHVSCPIFVARQWFRHRFAAYNEISYRYTEVTDQFYIPSSWRAQDRKNKQGSLPAPELDQKALTGIFIRQVDLARAAYRQLLAAGVAREMARMVLPVNLYTEFYWTVNARSLMNFLSLRADTHAQWEIQQYAEALAGHFASKMPWTWSSFLSFAWKGTNPKISTFLEASPVTTVQK